MDKYVFGHGINLGKTYENRFNYKLADNLIPADYKLDNLFIRYSSKQPRVSRTETVNGECRIRTLIVFIEDEVGLLDSRVCNELSAE